MPRQSPMQFGRYYSLDGGDDGRAQESPELHRRQPPMRIDEALRSLCGIVAKTYFVAAITEDGEGMSFFSPGKRLPENTVRYFFSLEKLKRVVKLIESGLDPDLGELFDSEEFSRSGYFRDRASENDRDIGGDERDNLVRQNRKKRRGHEIKIEIHDIPPIITSRVGIKVADSRTARDFYNLRFTKSQQNICKILAKAWVKAVEPKKQSNYPYTKRESSAPDWWPTGKLPGQKEVRHIEPDHLYRPERIDLLIHILQMVMEPFVKQHPAVRRAGLNVKKLEHISFEALSSFFQESEKNAQKRPFLVEIFQVAKGEERYRNGEIDDTTEIFVMNDEDRSPSITSSMPPMKVNEDHELPWSKPNGTVVSQPVQSSPRSNAQPGHLVSELPLRSSHFAPPITTEGTVQQQQQQQQQTQPQPQQQQTFGEGNGIPVHIHTSVSAANGCVPLEGVPSPNETNRRTSLYSDYPTPANSVYPQPWQPCCTSTAASPMYSYAPTQSSPTQAQPPGFVGQPVALNSDPAYTVGSFEGALRPVYNSSPTTLFRSGGLSQTSPASHPPYSYAHEDTQGLREAAPGLEVVPRNRSGE